MRRRFVDRYEVLRHLHRGETADVFLVRQWADGGLWREVVLKRLHAHHAEDEYARLSFQDEARLLSVLHHPAFPAFYDLRYVERAGWLIAMELMRGFRLDQVLSHGAQAGHPLPTAVALSVALALCDALEHAHAAVGPDHSPAPIFHCNVTSENVVLEPSGTVRLLDFGAASSPLRRVLRTGVRENVSYMAPEQVSEGALDARTDVFAVGALLYHLTTGRLPIERDDDLELLRAIAQGELTPPSERRERYPVELEAVVLAALSTDPDDRPNGPEALARGIRRFALEDGLLTGPRVLANHLRSALPPVLPFDEVLEPTTPPSFVVRDDDEG